MLEHIDDEAKIALIKELKALTDALEDLEESVEELESKLPWFETFLSNISFP